MTDATAMVVRRPDTFAAFDSTIRTAFTCANVTDKDDVRREFNTSMRHVADVWFDAGLRPVYEANRMVSFLTNSLATSLVELIVDDHKLVQLYSAACNDSAAYARRKQRLDDIFNEIRSACTASEEKDVSERFAEFRAATRCLVTDQPCVHGLEILYQSHGVARKILGLVLHRLTTSLRNDTDIVSSADMPLEVFAFG